MTAEKVMNKMPLLGALLLCLALGLALTTPRDTKEHMVGKRVEAFSIPVVGKKENLSPDSWKGHAAIVNIFASWCEPCKLEHPLLMNLAKTSRVPIYAIAWRDKEDAVVALLKKQGNPYALVALDEKGATTVPFSMTGVPETYVLDKEGVVRFHNNGTLTEDIIESRIVPLLESLQ